MLEEKPFFVEDLHQEEHHPFWTTEMRSLIKNIILCGKTKAFLEEVTMLSSRAHFQ